MENGAEEAAAPASKSWSKSKKTSANGTDKENLGDNLAFRISHKVSYKTVLKGKDSLSPPYTNVVFLWIFSYTKGDFASPNDDKRECT
jgi:hypothetical protein